jgi:transcriptional regulator with XRE-family HTH domain
MRGISKERLAFDAGIDRSYLGGLERRQGNRTVDLLDRLAATLGVSISDLFQETQKGSAAAEAASSGEKTPP